MKKITIINAYGDKNIGDAAILKVALEFIEEAFGKKCEVAVLSENGELKTSEKNRFYKLSAFQLPYGYAIKSNAGRTASYLKSIRLFKIYIRSLTYILLNKYLKRKLPRTGFYSYIYAIKDAEIVVGMGGGYFITKGFRDYFGLSLTLLPVYVAKLYSKKIVFLPISFGPFAYRHQERLCYFSLKNTTILARDHFTLDQIKSNDASKKINIAFAPDLALFLAPQKSNKVSNYITLTAREWLPTKFMQKNYEYHLGDFINKIWEKYEIKTYFIVMARNKAEDDDNEIASRIRTHVEAKESYQILNPAGVKEAQRLFSNARVAICTRMHSAILSATTSTPFIAIGYGHKTQGLAKILNLEKWYIDIEQVTAKRLFAKFKLLLSPKNTESFINKLSVKLKENHTHKRRIIELLRSEII